MSHAWSPSFPQIDRRKAVFKEFDVVIARKDLPNQSGIGSAKTIAKGQRGTVLMAYGPSEEYPKGACDVEFCRDLETLAVMLVDAKRPGAIKVKHTEN